jgi:hypothetical protein
MPEVMARAEELTRQQQEQQQHEEGQAGAREAQAPGDEQDQEGQEEGPSREALEGQEGAAAAPAGDRLKLDAATLRLVSKAVMGRLDVVDLVGRNTAEELAERVGASPARGACRCRNWRGSGGMASVWAGTAGALGDLRV